MEKLTSIVEGMIAVGIEWIQANYVSLIMAILIFYVGKWIAILITKAVKKMMLTAKVDETLVSFLAGIVKTVLMLFVVIAALTQLGVSTASLVALLGAAGLAIGLALKDSLQNFASGVMLIMFRPFSVGDFVEAAGVAGTIEKVSIFSTTMKTGDNKEIIIPNGSIYGGTITNYSARATRRVDMIFGIGYGDDLLKAKQVLLDLANADKRIHDDPAPMVAVKELGDSSVNFIMRVWADTPEYWNVYFDMHEKVKLEFDKQGISIPFPQMDVHLDKN